MVSAIIPFPFVGLNIGADVLNGCLLPYHLSRETRPCVRSISWSPGGLASNAGYFYEQF